MNNKMRLIDADELKITQGNLGGKEIRMNKFIEVHFEGEPRLINLARVEDVRKTGINAEIFFAFAGPDCSSQDCIPTDESYEEIRELVSNAQGVYTLGRE